MSEHFDEKIRKQFFESVEGVLWQGTVHPFRFNYLDPSIERLTGYHSDELKKEKFFESIVVPDDRERIFSFYLERQSTASKGSIEFEIIGKNGNRIRLRDTVAAVKDGEELFLTGMLSKITGSPEIEHSEQLLQKAYKLAEIGYWFLDLNNEDLYWSPLVKELHEVTPDYKPNYNEAINFYKEGYNRKTIQQTVQQSIKNGDSFDVELVIITAKGTERWVRVVGESEFENGKCVALYGSTQNIDQKKKVEKELRDTDQKLRDIIEHSTNMFYRHDANHVLQYVSPQFEKFLGYNHGEMLDNWTILATDHPVNKKGYELTQKAIDTGKAQPQYELQLKKKSGEPMWVRVYEAPVVENGKTVAIVGSLTDITESKKYEDQLEKLSLVASKTTDLIMMSDKNDRILWVNESFEKFTGYSLEECKGKIPSEFLQGPDTDPESERKLREAISKHRPFETVILNYKKNGESYWTDITIDPIVNDEGESTGFIAIGKDVSDLIARENKLRESVERYEIVAKATSDTIWDLDLMNDNIRYNDNIYHMFGYKNEQVAELGQWWRDKIHPDDYSVVINTIEDALNNKEERFQLEYRFRCEDGSYKYVYDRAFIVTDVNGKPARMIGAMQDVTGQRAEKRWLKLLESAVTNSSEAIAILEAKPAAGKKTGRKILFVNDSFTNMTGFDKAEVVDETLYILKGENTSDETLAQLGDSMNRWEPCQAEFINYKKDGTEFWINVSMAPVIGEDGEYSHWVFIGRDVTERIEHEQKLSESLNEKETLLVEIHHRVKNNLAVVSSMMLLQALEEENEKVTEKLYDSVARIKAMANIHELLYNSKSFSNINFSENISKLAKSVIATIQTDVDISLELNCVPEELNVNQAIPCSLLLNEILTNAVKHAFTGRKEGKIWIELRSTENCIHLSVVDDGCGIPDSILENVKSSVGLHLVDVLSKQLNAEYFFESGEENKGTRFSLNFKKSEVKGIGNAHL